MIYVVRGTTGEYSDRDEWPVRAFTNEDEAKSFVERCSAYARESFANHDARFYAWIEKGDFNSTRDFNPLDPNYKEKHTSGTNYFYEAVPVDAEATIAVACPAPEDD